MITTTKSISIDLEGIALKLLNLSVLEWHQEINAPEIDVFYGKAVNGTNIKLMVNYSRKQIIAAIHDDSFKRVYATFSDLPGLTSGYPH